MQGEAVPCSCSQQKFMCLSYFYADLGVLTSAPTHPDKKTAQVERRKAYVTRLGHIYHNSSYQFGDWTVFPCEHLHTSCPGCQMGIKGKPAPSRRRLRSLKVQKPSLLKPLYSLAGVLQTKCLHFIFLSLFASKLQEGILISAWHGTGKKHLFLFTHLLVPHLTRDF